MLSGIEIFNFFVSDHLKQTNTHNCVGIEKFQDPASGSKLTEQTLLSWTCNTLSSLTYCL